jgi:hypothetical protein
MAYLLEHNAFNRYVSISSVTIGATVGDYIEVESSALAGNADGSYRIAGGSSSFANRFVMNPDTAGGVAIAFNNTLGRFTSGYVQPAAGVDFICRLERISSLVWEVFLDGASLGTYQTTATLTIDQFFRLATDNTSCYLGRTSKITISQAGTVRTWDASLSNGTGSTLPTNDGTNQGTLNNFPVDDSQWFDDSPNSPNTPINLGFANLQPNSVRFTWEQG